VLLQQPLTNVSLNGCESFVKKLCGKTLAQDTFWQKIKAWWVKDWSKNQCEIFNFVDLWRWVDSVCSAVCAQPEHELMRSLFTT